jgi:hypothetical protein
LRIQHACSGTVAHTERYALFIVASGAAGAGAAAAAAEAQGTVNRRGRISTSGLDTSESAEDSEDADAILPMPMHISICSPTAAAAQDVPARGAGRSNRGVAASRSLMEDGRSEVAHDAAAAAAKGASYYRRLRRERRQPAAGELIVIGCVRTLLSFCGVSVKVGDWYLLTVVADLWLRLYRPTDNACGFPGM